MNNLSEVMSLAKSQINHHVFMGTLADRLYKTQSSVDERGQEQINECLAQALADIEKIYPSVSNPLNRRKLEATIMLDSLDGKMKLYILGEGNPYKVEIRIERNDARFSWLLENALVKARARGYNIWRAEIYR